MDNKEETQSPDTQPQTEEKVYDVTEEAKTENTEQQTTDANEQNTGRCL